LPVLYQNGICYRTKRQKSGDQQESNPGKGFSWYLLLLDILLNFYGILLPKMWSRAKGDNLFSGMGHLASGEWCWL
jgi:hypothetical protein